MTEAFEAEPLRQIIRKSRLDVFGGNWDDFCGKLGFDPIEDGDPRGSFVPVGNGFPNIRLVYVIKSRVPDWFDSGPLYVTELTYTWWY